MIVIAVIVIVLVITTAAVLLPKLLKLPASPLNLFQLPRLLSGLEFSVPVDLMRPPCTCQGGSVQVASL